MIKETPDKTSLAGILRRPRYEVIPLPGIEEQVAEHVPRDVTLTVTASPKKGLGATLATAGRLAKSGYRVSPHLSARLVVDEWHLREILQRMNEQGIREAFVIAGDAAVPEGKFAGAVDLLAAMAEIGHGLEGIGISGYPESHPFISDEATIRAMNEKAPYATYIASQICFDPKVISGWVERVRRRGVELPVYIGIPGVVKKQKLMRIAVSIGLGESARFLRKQQNVVLRLLQPGGYKPDRLIEGLAPAIEDPWYRIHGFHIYTFNELRETEAWRRRMLRRLQAAA